MIAFVAVRIPRSLDHHYNYAPSFGESNNAHKSNLHQSMNFNPGNDKSHAGTASLSTVKQLPLNSLPISASLTGPKHENQQPQENSSLNTPYNLSIVLTKWYPQPAIRVSWNFDEVPDVPCEAFQILYHPLSHPFRYIIEVPCNNRSVIIEKLLPGTEYRLTVNSVPVANSNHVPVVAPSTDSASLSVTHKPNVIQFISPQVEYSRRNRFKSSPIVITGAGYHSEKDETLVKTGELAVVLFVLTGWILMIFVFVKKWGRIRGIETVSTYSNVVTGASVANAAAVVAANAFNQMSPTQTSGSIFPTVAGYAPGMTGAQIKAQKSRESDGSGSASGGHDTPGPGTGHTHSFDKSKPNLQTCSSLKKKRLEDAIHQFMLVRNQSAGYRTGGCSIFDTLQVVRRQVRSQESSRSSGSSSHRRRGSLEHRSKMLSDSDLNQDHGRMNRSAENLLALDFS